MRKFNQTTEAFMALVGMLVLYRASSVLSPLNFNIAVAALVASYVISRSMFKSGRSPLVYSGVLSSELYVSCYGVAVPLFSLPADLGAYFAVGQICLYILCRGFVKTLPRQVKSQALTL